MKTIEERAKQYARKVWRGGVRDFVSHKKATELDFIAGAQSEQKELTRWRDPKKEQPEDGAIVLGKTSDPKQPFAIMKYYNNIWWIWAQPCWAGPSGEVIGWRPIDD